MTRPSDKPQAPPSDEHATLASASRAEESPLDGTLALPGSIPPPSVEMDQTCRLDEPEADDTQHLPPHPVSPTGSSAPLDQTLALPEPSATASPSLGDRTERLTEPGATRGEAVLEQTLNQPSAFAEAPTRPAPRRHPSQEHDTNPLSAGGEHTAAPATRHHEPTRMPVTEPIAGAGPTRLPSVPGYVILSELGRGGMGVVYKARHVKLNRVVALKMIRSGANAGSEDLRRFRDEAEAVARLQHPNIVQIYEVGECDGLPFFSLEFIDGGSLHQRLNHDTGMPAREAAELVETLARAMHYAHERGIVHRDLKPANVMLASGGHEPPVLTTGSASSSLGVPKITDFGLAKKLEEKDTGHTREGSILGTPSYMAPEQASGKLKEIGPAADIYALGAILYDLLASRPPFKGETLMDTLQQVINVEPMPPAHLQPSVPRDLDTITLKCLEKEPHKRYSSAGALADDLRRFLNHEPIEARATPWWEKAVKWGRRRPAAAALVLLAVLFVFGLIGGSVWIAVEQNDRARAEAERAKAESDRASLQTTLAAKESERAQREQENAQAQARLRVRAESRARDAMLAVDGFLTRVADRKLEHVPQLQVARREMLAEALAFLQTFARDNRDDPTLREQLAFAQRRLGYIHELLGDRARAEDAYRAALDLARELQKAGGKIEQRRLAAVIADKLAVVLHQRNQVKDAEKLFDHAITDLEEIGKQYPGPEARAALLASVITAPWRPAGERWLAVAQLSVVETWSREAEMTHNSLAEALVNRANLFLTRGEAGRGRKDLLAAVDLLESLSRLAPDSADFRANLATAHGGIAVSWYGENLVRANQSLGEAIVILDRLVVQYPRIPNYHAELAQALKNRALIHEMLSTRGPQSPHDEDGVEKDYRRSVALLQKVTADFDTVWEFRELLRSSQNDLALFLRNTERFREAATAWEDVVKTIDAFPPALRQSPERLVQRALAQEERATALLRLPMARVPEAVELWKQSIDTLTRLVENNSGERQFWGLLCNRHHNRLQLWKQQGRTAEQIRDARLFIPILELKCTRFGNRPEDLAELAGVVHDLGLALRDRGQAPEGERLLNRAVNLQKQVRNGKPDDADSHYKLCLYQLALNDHHGVVSSVEAWEKRQTIDRKSLRFAAQCLARAVVVVEKSALGETERKKLAEQYAREAVRLLETAARAGFRDLWFYDSDEFAVLRNRDDFKVLASR